MRVVFAGTPDFARVALAALAEAGHELPLVLTQPDRPAGRGLQLQPSPVKQEALQRGLPVLQPRGLRLDGRYADDAAAARAALVGARPEVVVVAAYGLILPRWLLELPPKACLNIHASLLPRWRGAAPVQRAIEAGDDRTGITLMRMDQGLDTGPMLASEPVAIGADDTAGSLQGRLATIGAALLVRMLPGWAEGRIPEVPQPDLGVTYAAKVDKSEAEVDWREPASRIERRLRAFDPAPGARASIGGEQVKLWRGRVVEGKAAAGTVLPSGPRRLVVACGEGALELLEVQRPGGRRGSVAEYLRAHPLEAGTLLPARAGP